MPSVEIDRDMDNITFDHPVRGTIFGHWHPDIAANVQRFGVPIRHQDTCGQLPASEFDAVAADEYLGRSAAPGHAQGSLQFVMSLESPIQWIAGAGADGKANSTSLIRPGEGVPAGYPARTGDPSSAPTPKTSAVARSDSQYIGSKIGAGLHQCTPHRTRTGEAGLKEGTHPGLARRALSAADQARYGDAPRDATKMGRSALDDLPRVRS